MWSMIYSLNLLSYQRITASMKKNIWPRFMTGALMVLSLGAITCTALTFSWFLGPNVSTKDDEYLGGNIGLREYFFSGDGSEEKPYEIVSPIHLYNLSRLQNLGIFPEKTYFQVGHTFDIEGVPSLRCIDHYDNEGNPVYTEYLAMGTFSNENTVYTIGGEGVPFVGSINGNGIPIKNLKVSGNPEDIGVFGYVSHEGYLEGLVFDNLQITSLGYSNDTSSPENKLFSEDIDDIFTSSSYLATDVSLDIYRYNNLAEEYYATNLTKRNGTTGTAIDSLNADGDLITGTMYYNGYFKPTFPNIVGDQFTYSITSSSPILKKAKDVNIQGCSVNDLVLDLSLLEESSSFNSTANAQVNAKIYLSASCVVDGFTFTRVIQSYSLEIYNKVLFRDQLL